jgi:MoaA/NifB/PqqE/SkfB family radical SAM enzyme
MEEAVGVMKSKVEETSHFPYTLEDIRRIRDQESFPQMVVINTTYVCNAQCPHCPYTNSDIRKEPRAQQFPYMSEEVFKVIADQVGRARATLRISGAGEPLLHKKIVDFIGYAKRQGCQVGLISNGSLLSEGMAVGLLNSQIDMIEFSVDAADPETYGKVRKGLHFEKTMENIKRCVRLRNEQSAKTNIIASVVNQKLVSDKIDEIVSFWESIVDKVQVRKYLTWDINDLDESGDIAPYLTTDAPCPFPFDRLMIDSNGDARFCVYDIKGRTHWGNVMLEPITAIWKNQDFQFLREIHIQREFEKFPICKNCLDRQFRSWSYNYFALRESASLKRNKTVTRKEACPRD